MSTLVDSNVILDFINEFGGWAPWSAKRLRSCAEAGSLRINTVIFAEASVLFVDKDSFDEEVPASRFIREEVPLEAAFLAGKAHLKYRRSGGLRDRTLPDFLIGAHAAVKGYRLLTRDARRYRAYFPDLDIIAPDTHP